MAFEITKVQEEVLARILVKMEPFNGLSLAQIGQLVENSSRLILKKGNRVYEPGDAASHVYLLLEGAVKVTTPDSGSREVIHELINSPSLFGLSNCCGDHTIKNNAISISHVTVCYRIPFRVVKGLMLENASFNLRVFAYLSEYIQEMEKRLETLMLSDARERVIGFIRKQAQRKGIRIGYEILLKHSFTQQDIADFTGTSRQTVTNILKELREQNRIKIERGSLLIRDLDGFK